MTLREFLELNNGNTVEVCVKEPDKWAKYWTVLKDGVSNTHTDNDLDRKVYSIDMTYYAPMNGNILMVYCW